MDEHSLMRIDVAAKALGMGKQTLYRMCARHLIPVYRIGLRRGGLRVDLQEVRATLRKETKEQGKER